MPDNINNLSTEKQSQRILKALLKHRRALEDERGSGSVKATILLLDLENALKKAKLSPREQQTLVLLYEYGLTERQAVKILDVKRDAIRSYNERALNKILIHTQFTKEDWDNV